MEHMHHDHSHYMMGMGDGGMDHGGGGGMDMGGKCSMHMLWNTQIIDTCVVFPSWHIRTHTQFVLSFLVIVGLGVLYEYLRILTKGVDRRVARGIARNVKGKSASASGPNNNGTDGRVNAPTSNDDDREGDAEDSALLTGRRVFKPVSYPVPLADRIVRATLYASLVFLSFFLMLIFMTYNAYLIFAVVLGAGIGHYILGAAMDIDSILGGGADAKAMTCH